MQNDNSQLKSATIALFRNSEEGLLLYTIFILYTKQQVHY
jgi:hypothetical protein